MSMLGITPIVLIVFSYLLGTFPTGQLIARARGVDLTKTGSGSVGATNVTRALGRKAGIATLIIDALKGALAVWLAPKISSHELAPSIGAVCVVLGHCFSIPGYMKGGKGVGPSLGTISVLLPLSAVVSLLTYGVVFAITRVSSISSLSAVASVVIVAIWKGTAPIAWTMVALAAIILSRHRENIKRLLQGKERKIG